MNSPDPYRKIYADVTEPQVLTTAQRQRLLAASAPASQAGLSPQAPAAAPRRFGPGEPYRASQVSPRGTVVVKAAVPWGSGAMFETVTPCCGHRVRISAVAAAYHGLLPADAAGVHKTCPGCGWKWIVRLARDGTLLAQLPEDAAHPHIEADQAEWASQGCGTRSRRTRS